MTDKHSRIKTFANVVFGIGLMANTVYNYSGEFNSKTSLIIEASFGFTLSIALLASVLKIRYDVESKTDLLANQWLVYIHLVIFCTYSGINAWSSAAYFKYEKLDKKFDEEYSY